MCNNNQQPKLSNMTFYSNDLKIADQENCLAVYLIFHTFRYSFVSPWTPDIRKEIQP